MRLFRLIALAAALLPVMTMRAQNFNYSFSHATASYQDIGTPASLNNNTDWSYQHFIIPIGFSFNYLGQSFDSLRIETNGFFVFGNNNHYGLAAFNGVECVQDSTGQYSSLGYELSGSTGNRILKIEYRNVHLTGSSQEARLNYQLWLYEQGNVIEVHTGNNSYSGIEITPLIGLMNLEQDANPKALLLGSTSSQPVIQSIGLTDNLIYISEVPAAGTVYTFTPSLN